jgi:hypothetical protein
MQQGSCNGDYARMTAYAEVWENNPRCFSALSMTVRLSLIGAVDRQSGNCYQLIRACGRAPALRLHFEQPWQHLAGFAIHNLCESVGVERGFGADVDRACAGLARPMYKVGCGVDVA